MKVMNEMPFRSLGKNISVGAIGYGAMGLSEFYGPTDDVESLSLLNTIVERGVSMIDTADTYGLGHNESLIGSMLKNLNPSLRDKLTIATKCGIDRWSSSGYERKINNDPKYIVKSCNDSLKRLGVEHIGLYYIHRIDKNAQIEETMHALEGLAKSGKIGGVGLCEVSAELLIKAHAVFPVDVVQTEYSLWTRDIETNLLPVLKDLNIGLVPYSPLGRGFLTGQYQNAQEFAENDFRRNNPRFTDKNISANNKLLEAIQPMTQKYGCTSGQIALAWLLSQWEHIVPIPGTKREKYFNENIGACHIHLDETDLINLNELKSSIVIHGDRYSPEGMKGIS